jgi:hypothetical protein
MKYYENNKNNISAFSTDDVPFDALRYFAISLSKTEVAA